MYFLEVLFLLIGAYLLGSVPSAVWVGRAFRGVDVREHGSGNAGTTNTIRVLGIGLGLLVFVIDLLKGFLAVRLVSFLSADSPYSPLWISLELGVVVTLGHIFPLFAGFRGGKGVATLCGVGLALHPEGALCALGVFTVVLILTRYVSLGSMLAGLSFPLFLYFGFHVREFPLLLFASLVAVLLLVTHRSNVIRLLHGEEGKFRVSRSGSLGSTKGSGGGTDDYSDGDGLLGCA